MFYGDRRLEIPAPAGQSGPVCTWAEQEKQLNINNQWYNRTVIAAGSGYDGSNWEIYQHLNSSLFISKSFIPPQFQIMTISFLLWYYKAFLHRYILYIDLHPAGVQNRVWFDVFIPPMQENLTPLQKRTPLIWQLGLLEWQLFPCRMKLMPPLKNLLKQSETKDSWW